MFLYAHGFPLKLLTFSVYLNIQEHTKFFVSTLLEIITNHITNITVNVKNFREKTNF